MSWESIQTRVLTSRPNMNLITQNMAEWSPVAANGAPRQRENRETRNKEQRTRAVRICLSFGQRLPSCTPQQRKGKWRETTDEQTGPRSADAASGHRDDGRVPARPPRPGPRRAEVTIGRRRTKGAAAGREEHVRTLRRPDVVSPGPVLRALTRSARKQGPNPAKMSANGESLLTFPWAG